MALSGGGLQTQIWNNNLKSTLLLAGYPFLLLGMLWAFFYLQPTRSLTDHVVSTSQGYWAGGSSHVQLVTMRFLEFAPWLAVGVGVWFLIAYTMHQSIINASTGAQPLERRDAPKIYNMVENLCISRGIPMPKLFIIEHDALNAYASGIKPSNFAITVTRGLLNALRDDELEAVLAHELSHIRNRDVRLMIVSIIFVGIIAFLCDMAFRWLAYGPRSSSRDRNGGAQMLIGFAVLAVGYVFAILIRFALSRRREFLADAGAVELTHNPDAMIRALRRIEGQSSMGAVSGEVEQLFIDNPPSFMGLFATHPSIEARVAALVGMGGLDVGAAMENDRHALAEPAESGPWNMPGTTASSPWERL